MSRCPRSCMGTYWSARKRMETRIWKQHISQSLFLLLPVKIGVNSVSLRLFLMLFTYIILKNVLNEDNIVLLVIPWPWVHMASHYFLLNIDLALKSGCLMFVHYHSQEKLTCSTLCLGMDILKKTGVWITSRFSPAKPQFKTALDAEYWCYNTMDI